MSKSRKKRPAKPPSLQNQNRNLTRERTVAGERSIAGQEIAMTRREVAVSYSHSGPLPDPMTLQKYDQILPGCAERLVKMVEEQSAHRRELEAHTIKSRSRDSLLGIISGFIIALCTIGAGTFIIYNGQVWSGTFIGSAGLVGLVSVFVYGTRSNRKEREEKNKQS